jgi:hypothetical protein
MRWTRRCRALSGAERSALSRTAKACGPGTPGLVSSLAEMICEATVTKKVMDTGASTQELVNTIAQGMSVDPAKPVVTAACFFVAGGPWARPSPGIPCALSAFEDAKILHNSGAMRRGNAALCFGLISPPCNKSVAKQN